MIRNVLVAVSDSSDGWAAAHLAIEIAGGLDACLRVVHVVVDHELEVALTTVTRLAPPGVLPGESALLARVAGLAEAADVAAETRLLRGPVGRAVLEEAHAWPADLVVIGRAGRWHSGEPYVGAQTRHVLEFAAVPVLVVPRTSGRPE